MVKDDAGGRWKSNSRVIFEWQSERHITHSKCVVEKVWQGTLTALGLDGTGKRKSRGKASHIYISTNETQSSPLQQGLHKPHCPNYNQTDTLEVVSFARFLTS